MKVHNQGQFGSRAGQILILGSLSTMVVFGTLGLAADLGWSYFTKMQLQTAADAAASGAAVYAFNNGVNSDSCSRLTCGVSYTCAGVTPATNALQAGCLYARADAPPGAIVTMVENAGANLASGVTEMLITATVTTSNHNLFLFWSGFHTASVLGQAVGGFTVNQPGGCIYAMSTSASQALKITGNSTVTTGSCGVYINSTASDALYLTGSPYLGATGGGIISVNGGSSISVGGHALPDPSPAPLLNNGAVNDPLTSVPAPAVSGCTHNTATGTSTSANYSLGSSQTDTIYAGTYCGGITVGGSATLTITPGIYIMNGGGFSVGNSGTVNATHVMVYNASSTGHSGGAVSISGAAIVNLTAPNSGPYQGIAFFQQRNLPTAASIANSGSGNITGTYYFFDAPFSFTGNTSTATTSAFIASTITITGSSNLTNDSSGKITGLAKTTVSVMQ